MKYWEKLPKYPAVTTADIAAPILHTTAEKANKILEQLSRGGWAAPVVELLEPGEPEPLRTRYHVLPEEAWPVFGFAAVRVSRHQNT